MSSGIRVNGFDFDDMERFILDKEIDEYKQKRALKNAVKKAKQAIEDNLPIGKGKTKKSVKQKSKASEFGATEVVYIDDWKWIFQEFRNTKQTGKYVGLAEKSVESVNEDIYHSVLEELMK